jgi:hypothetical protein
LEDLRGVALTGLPGERCRVLVVQSSGNPRGDGYLGLSGREVAVEEIGAPSCWVEEGDFGAGAVPVAVLRRLVEWLT